MKTMIWVAVAFSLTLVGAMASARTGEASQDDPRYALVTARIEEGVAQLTASIEGLDKRMADLERPPEQAGAMFNDLQAMDLSAWQLRRQQWVLQRDHLTFARQLLQQTVERPSDKTRLAEQWSAHKTEYQAKLEAMRQERYVLERKRFQAEGQLIEQFLLH